MIWFPFILAVQFLGLLPSTTQAVRYRPSNAKDPANGTPSGIALLYSGGKEFCSGTLLKPWIVLTTAECVKDKVAESVIALVWCNATGPDSSSSEPNTVRVANIYIDPTYDADLENNFAVLIIHGQLNCTVGEYGIVPYLIEGVSHPTNDTFTYLWLTFDGLTYESVLVPTALGNITTCGKTFDMYSQYCLVKKNPPGCEYSYVDFGVPAFVLEDNQKKAFAMYTQHTPGLISQGYAYQSLWPRYYWIEGICDEHPIPPE